jgi:hypothetical protein
MNPLFNVQQRGVGSWTGGGYTADRWTQYIGGGDTCSTALYPLSDADRTQIGDDVARWTLGLTFTGTATSTSQITLLQNIEDVRRTSGKTVTLSFWARNVSGSARVGIAWAQAFGTGGSPSASVNVNLGATPLLTASFTRYTFTVSLPSINGKTLGSNNDSYLGIQLFMSCAPSNANNGVAGGIGVQSGSANLWGVQLEVGSVATPLDYGGSPQQQLAQCQRFYVNGSVSLYSYNQAGAYVTQAISLPVPMRATPTVVPTLTPANLTGTTMDALNPYQVRCLGTATALGACNAIGTFTASADL